MSVGQLYVVKTRARIKQDNSIEYASYIVASQSKDEVEMKLSYFVDKSLYSEFSIKAVQRVKPNFHMISRRVVSDEEYAIAKATEDQMAGSDGAENTVTLQKRNRNIFAFGCVGNILASSEKQAMKRVSDFLARRSMDSNAKLPFVSAGHLIIEEVGESDSTATPKLDKFENESVGGARMIGGGGCSPR